jgi:hypothetical protein
LPRRFFVVYPTISGFKLISAVTWMLPSFYSPSLAITPFYFSLELCSKKELRLGMTVEAIILAVSLGACYGRWLWLMKLGRKKKPPKAA